MPVLLAAALLLSAPPARAEGFDEGMTLGDLADVMKKAESKLKAKEGALKKAGILGPTGSVAAQNARITELAESQRDGRPPKLPADDKRLGFGGGRAGAGALEQLTATPGAKSRRPGDLNGVPLNEKRPPTEDELAKARIEAITAAKVSASVARESYARMLWTAYKAPEGAGSTGEVKGLVKFLKEQVSEKEGGRALWPVGWDPDMPTNILATYSGVIKVGDSFAALGTLGQMTVMFHEMMHGHDDGGDGSAIEVNRMTGQFQFDPKHPSPAMRNAAEMLSYTDMAKWVEAL
ncbi:hypothetical protein EPO15_11395 [bacterium]|nr:MAG: hypothetical protein EPO15_11395 [bacterium]